LIADDRYNNAIREIDIPEKKVSTLAEFGNGFEDGPFTQAKINSMLDMTVDGNINIYTLDVDNKEIRKIFIK